LEANAVIGFDSHSSTIIGHSKWTRRTMDICENPVPHKSPSAVRDRLPNRRCAISTSFQRDGARFEMTERDIRGEAASPIGAALDKIS
jgi:hypothetical protein